MLYFLPPKEGQERQKGSNLNIIINNKYIYLNTNIVPP
jgi:hypothetical protein